jgi:hypothetical protein
MLPITSGEVMQIFHESVFLPISCDHRPPTTENRQGDHDLPTFVWAVSASTRLMKIWDSHASNECSSNPPCEAAGKNPSKK